MREMWGGAPDSEKLEENWIQIERAINEKLMVDLWSLMLHRRQKNSVVCFKHELPLIER